MGERKSQITYENQVNSERYKKQQQQQQQPMVIKTKINYRAWYDWLAVSFNNNNRKTFVDKHVVILSTTELTRNNNA